MTYEFQQRLTTETDFVTIDSGTSLNTTENYSYGLTTTADMNQAVYRLRIFQDLGGDICEVFSDELTLEVNTPITAVTITATETATGTTLSVPDDYDTYLWTPGGATTSSIDNAVAGETYSVTVSNSDACAPLTSPDYTVPLPLPLVCDLTIEPITDIILLCEDDSTIIRPVIENPNSLSLSYSWFVDEGAGYTELTGEIGNSLSLTGVPATADGNKYRFVATHNADCGAEITDIELSVDVPPVVAFNTSFSFSNTEAAQEVFGGATQLAACTVVQAWWTMVMD